MNQKLLIILILLFQNLEISAKPSSNDKPQNNGFHWVQNNGQWDKTILFRSIAAAHEIQLQANGIQYYFFDPIQTSRLGGHHAAKLASDTALSVHGLNLTYLNSKGGKPQIETTSGFYHNYFLGNNPAQWQSKVPVAVAVSLQNLYQGISLYLKNDQNKLKYEYHIAPNAKLADLQIKIEGAQKIYLQYGELYIQTSFETLKETRPIAWQYIDGRKVEVEVNFRLEGSIISFEPNASYNTSYPLVIDPEIVFLTYSGSTADNFGCSATYGENGTLYAAGITTGPSTIANGKYPTTAGAFQLDFAGGGFSEGEIGLSQFPCDITISKYSADGSQLLYATYLGGTNNEIPHSLVVDNNNNLVVLGNTYSANFPTTSGVFDNSHNGRHDIILSKFNANGQLIASTYLGGPANDGINFNNITNYFFADSYRGDVITDADNNIFICTFTQSDTFPTSSGVIQTKLNGTQDGVVAKFSPGLSTLEWSTLLGGSGVDAFYSIDFAKNGEILLCGGTNSIDFKTAPNSFQPSFAGGTCDGLIAKISSDGKTLLAATYFGTDQYDQTISLEEDADNNIYVVGQSKGTIPVTAGKYNNPNSHQFIASLTEDLKTKRWSTVFGSGRNQIDLTINAFLVDDCKRIYVSSWGGRTATKIDGTNSSTVGLQVTTDAFQTKTDGSDFYLMLLNKEASDLLYATFLGGDNPNNTGDHVDGGTSRFDKRGVVYQSMCASCPLGTTPFTDLKTTPANVFGLVNVSPRCSNAALKFDFRISKTQFRYTIDTCSSTFSFFNETPGAANFFWRFPDGDSSFQENPVKQLSSKYYNLPIVLITEFGTNCADTAPGSVNISDSLSNIKRANVFTPNGDGLNDEYRLDGAIGQCEEGEIFIYNRWGQLIFESKSINFRWNGQDQVGNEMAEGVYYYILKTKKRTEEQWKDYHGTITLIK